MQRKISISTKPVEGALGDVIKNRAADYDYALIYMMSSLYFGKASGIDNSDIDEVIEARLFGASGETHFYRTEKGLVETRIDERSEGQDYFAIDQKSPVMDHIGKGAKLLSRQYYAFDDDGQGYVKVTRLVGIEGGD